MNSEQGTSRKAMNKKIKPDKNPAASRIRKSKQRTRIDGLRSFEDNITKRLENNHKAGKHNCWIILEYWITKQDTDLGLLLFFSRLGCCIFFDLLSTFVLVRIIQTNTS